MANIKYLSAFSGMGSDKMYLTYNGVPLKAVRQAPVGMQQPYKLLALGRFVGKKGYDFLLRGCKILKDRGIAFHLTLAGDGPRKIQLKRLSSNLGLRDNVSFPGFMSYDQVSDLFYSSDIFLMPSVIHSSGDRDGIPTVLMEALTHRVPVIATDVSGIGELVEDGVTGLLIPEKNPEAIAEGVMRMIADRQGAIQMAERGQEKVLQQFNPEINHKRVFELYQSLIPARGVDDVHSE
jgi:glycosyltransferase involved in cell wall biosynthesis